MTFDPLRALRTLQEHDVEFIVIGGIAAAAHGSPSVTMDLDVCYKRTPENLERLSAALRTLHAKLRRVDHDVPFLLDAKTLEAGDHFTLLTDAGDLDCMATPSGVQGYEDLLAEAVPVDLDGLRVLVASVDDLIRMKRAAARPKDLVEAEILGALRDELDSR
jgi:predicted nucleotidyltransferase